MGMSSRFVMIADSETDKVAIWDGNKQLLLCNFGEAEQGGWNISTVQEITVLAESLKPEKILYALHDLLSDAKNSSIAPIPVGV
jgi:hypothetical protein